MTFIGGQAYRVVAHEDLGKELVRQEFLIILGSDDSVGKIEEILNTHFDGKNGGRYEILSIQLIAATTPSSGEIAECIISETLIRENTHA